ncbi:type VI secretion system tip protein TssI/VgrG [Acinetobacter larvae]|uniref:Type VI secretion system protein n=1 Tax=Acinetobacter larvae TaxID=1789224 RepID=A0A1B2LYM0_9GAMM|nr:type VI secretion system tip protein TssI/VgrG [Acinetobacter larvae]AOA58025.1 type VI secretion system protein [Acinetobacter larvae]
MFNNIQNILADLGLSAQKRAIHAQFSNSSLNEKVFLQRIEGEHGLNQGFTAELICLSLDATIALKEFIGCQLAVDQVTDRGELFRSTGIVSAASQGQSDGALTVYKLTLQDATTLWHKRRNSRVFMNKSVVDVIQALFKEWQQKSPLFAASLKLDLSGLSKDYDIRPFIMQANETDYDFLTRLMRAEGINWLIDEAQLIVANSSESIQAQKLRLIDSNDQYQALNRRSIRFHRSDATEQFDSITRFVAQRSLQPTAVYVNRWQADALDVDEGAGSVLTTQQHSSQQDSASLGLEDAWAISPAWMQDLKGEDGATPSGNRQVEDLNKNISAYHNAQAKQFIAQSTVRDAQVGYWFSFEEHPEIDSHSGADKEFLIIAKSFYNQNNLPKDLNAQVQALVSKSQWQRSTPSDERQANSLTLQRRNIAIVPEYNPLQHRPVAYPQRARVVGPAGESIHVDEWGRIKVRFLFTRSEDHSHDGGAGSNDNDSDSAWVDVLTPWAGEGYGARFLPRIGEIVAIDFFDGNVDRPFVLGRIHEAQRSPTQFDTMGQLPDTRRLSGIRSNEVGGGGYGQLRFDDTSGQISTQLQSSHGASQLNLGNLSHPKSAEESDGRGEGFELRTDQWGAVRAGQGLLLSTHQQGEASGVHLDTAQAKQQLESSLNRAKALSDTAKNQQTDPLEVLDNLKGYIENLEQQDQSKAAAFKEAIMLFTAPQSIAVSSSQDVHLSSDGQISHSAGDSINLSTQNALLAHAQSKISLFAATEGARLYAGQGNIEIQAQGDGADIIARKKVQIISTEDQIELIAEKKIVLTAGSSQIEISGAGIIFRTSQKFEAKAGQHVFKGGEKLSLPMPNIPPVFLPYSNKIDVYNFFNFDKLNDLNNFEYSALYENGNFQRGSLDKYGRTDRFRASTGGKVKVLIGGDEWLYYIDDFGGTRNEDTRILFLDFSGEPIPNLIFRLSDENNKEVLQGKTNQGGRAIFRTPDVEFPLLSVKKIIGTEFKPIVRIENNFVRDITFISPKILKEIELLKDTDEKGSYLRSNYSK